MNIHYWECDLSGAAIFFTWRWLNLRINSVHTGYIFSNDSFQVFTTDS